MQDVVIDEKKRSVLIIDDSQLDVSVLKQILDQDYIVTSAKDGREGLEVAKKLLPDVIVLDIIMPEMDGFEVIKVLKRDEQLKAIPVIFITGLTNVKEEETGLVLGGSDFILKPFSPEIVKLRVGIQVRLLDYISKIEHISMRCSMTGIPNRRSFDERLAMEWKRARRANHSMSILMIDIDHFKKYNDTYGHLNGDLVLQVIAKTIMKVILRPGDFAARWGGEEFIVLLPETDLDGALNVAERLRSSVEDTEICLCDGQITKTTVSVGVNTHIPSGGCVVSDFINSADDALYAAKAKGRNQVCSYNGV